MTDSSNNYIDGILESYEQGSLDEQNIAEQAAIDKGRIYRLVPLILGRSPCMSLFFDHYIVQEQYIDLRSRTFSRNGDSLMLFFTASPAIMCLGRNLEALELPMRRHEIGALRIYEENCYNNVPEPNEPVITSMTTIPPDEFKRQLKERIDMTK